MYYSLYNVKNAITVIQKLKSYKIDNILWLNKDKKLLIGTFLNKKTFIYKYVLNTNWFYFSFFKKFQNIKQ